MWLDILESCYVLMPSDIDFWEVIYGGRPVAMSLEEGFNCHVSVVMQFSFH